MCIVEPLPHVEEAVAELGHRGERARPVYYGRGHRADEGQPGTPDITDT